MTEEKALAIHQAAHLMPAMSLGDAADRFNALASFTKKIMREDIDYGTIPGTDKATLLKPGAEKLTTFFGLTVRYETIERTEDWTGAGHGNEPFFYYWFRCQLWRGDMLIAEADGSCNSWETKYRYRTADLVCPKCEQSGTIIKGKEEYGGGWLCWSKRGGCNAKWPDGAKEIEGQPRGRIPNPDPADLVNTIQKMAQKRALVAATLLAVNASEYYTQDLEDLPVVEGSFRVENPGAGDGKKRKAEKRGGNKEEPESTPFSGTPTSPAQLISALAPLEYYDNGIHMLKAYNKVAGTNYTGWPTNAGADFFADAYEKLVNYAKEQRAQDAIKGTAEQMSL